MIHLSRGFTAVELLVSIAVGALLLGSAFQLYTTVIRESDIAQKRSIASNIAYDLVRQNAAAATNPCTVKSPTAPAVSGLAGATASIAITCPYGTTSEMSLVTVTVTYNNPGQERVIRAITSRP